MSDARVLLVRPAGPDRDSAALESRGVAVESDAYITVGACTDDEAAGRAEDVLAEIADSADWLVTTSRAAPDALATLATAERLRDAVVTGQQRGLRFAAVGPVAAGALRAFGADDVVVPAQQDAEGLLVELLTRTAARVVTPVGNLARPTVADGLRQAGWTVVSPVVYETSTVTRRPPSADRLARGEFDVVVLRSPSAVAAVSTFVPVMAPGVIAVCGGPTTAAAARRSGFARIIVSDEPLADSVAEAVVRVLDGSME